MYFVAISLVAVIVYLIYHLLRRNKDLLANFPPGPPKLPIWGSYWFILKEDHQHAHFAFKSLAKKYETDLLGLHLGDAPTIVPVSYEACKEALVKEEFIGRNDTIILRHRGLGELRGVIFTDGPFWKDQRRFSLRHLRDFGFGRRSDRIEQYWADELKIVIDQLKSDRISIYDKDANPEKGVVLMPDFLYGPLMNSIYYILANKRFDNYQLRDIARAVMRFQRSGDATGGAITITPWLRFIAPEYFRYTTAIENNNYVLEFLKEIIHEHKQTFSQDHLRDFIDVFIEEQNRLEGDSQKLGYTDDQLLLLLLDFMFPPGLAVGQTLNFFFAHLVNNPRVQDKIFEEIERVVGTSRLPNLDDRKNMPYLEASIREAIRIAPFNPLGIARRCMEDTYFKGYFIPKDTVIIPNIWTAHRDESIFGKNTEQFVPERFLDSEGNLMKKDNTIGFGAGKRLCAGETFARHNMFLVTSALLQNFHFEAAYCNKIDIKLVPGANLSIDDNFVRAIAR